ncbi:MAG: DinB family protein [Phycisphaerales bacterium]|nr:DinB family protein [Phycisphaerales bacterium]
MNVPALIERLSRFPAVLRAMVMWMPEEDVRWRPEDGSWSILDIVRHLADEEVEDFRTRLRLTLQSPERDWPPIDPASAAVERRYNQQPFDQALRRFLDERAASLTWLRGLPAKTDWSTVKTHPKFPPLHAGSLLGAWVAHDLLHVRQIAKRQYQLTRRDAAPHDDIGYAGDPPA